jgi:cytochrome P450
MTDEGPPILGGSRLFGAGRDLRRDQLGTYRRALEAHGGKPVRFHLGPPKFGIDFDTVFTPDDARQVLATDNGRYDKEVPAFEEFRWVMGEGLITSEGDRWRRDRRIVAPLFTRKRIASYVREMRAAAERIMAAWPPDGGEVDLDWAGRHFALDVLGRVVFGADVEPVAEMLAATIPVLSEFATRRALSVVRVPASWPLPSHRKANGLRQQLFGFVDDLVARRRPDGLEGTDLLTLLLTAADPETGEALDDRAVRDHALTFLIAGHETTASAFAFTLHLLARHPDVQQRVRDEAAFARADVGVDALPFTAQVVDEALRLYPSGHTIVRRVCEPTTLGGHEEPVGRIVAVSVWGVHHNSDVWADPYRFDPGRFVAPPEDRYAHLPFGGGPRGCIGQQLALTELVVAVATVVQGYHLDAPPNVDPPLVVGATIRPRSPLTVRATKVGAVSPPGGRGAGTG